LREARNLTGKGANGTPSLELLKKRANLSIALDRDPIAQQGNFDMGVARYFEEDPANAGPGEGEAQLGEVFLKRLPRLSN